MKTSQVCCRNGIQYIHNRVFVCTLKLGIRRVQHNSQSVTNKATIHSIVDILSLMESLLFHKLEEFTYKHRKNDDAGKNTCILVNTLHRRCVKLNRQKYSQKVKFCSAVFFTVI